MTARVTTLKGAGAYYVEALPGYYLDPDEPAGRWFGRGAEELDLVGEVDAAAFLALMEGRDPRRTERWLGLRFGERSARGFDVTCSAPKSVSVLWALADPAIRAQVGAAHDAAVGALAGWIEEHAHTRFRIGGEVAVADANGIVAAAFRQHTSRAQDPQLHTHLVIANRVRSPDGRWLALDARLIKHDQRTLSALYHAGLRAELTTRLGVRWREPVNGISELADLPDALLEAFSTRTKSMRARGRRGHDAAHNDRGLVTDTGEHVRNRATWTVTAIHADETLTVTGHDGTITLPVGYVAEYVELAYARTAISAQGRTVDIGLLLLDHTTDIRNLYVPMTRGRTRNDVYAVTDGEQTARRRVVDRYRLDRPTSAPAPPRARPSAGRAPPRTVEPDRPPARRR